MTRRMARVWLGGVLGLLLCAGLTHATTAGTTAAATVSAKRSHAPNIVLILMDDFSMDLLRTMPTLRDLGRRSARFTHSYVADSLCCTSRATLFTGQYPHNTKVRSNTRGPDPAHPIGGWDAFRTYGNTRKSFNMSLDHSRRHYWTGFYGKYINQYPVKHGTTAPPGWDNWHAIGGRGYRQWKYRMTTRYFRGDKRVVGSRYYGSRPADYATSVLSRRAARFIKKRRNRARPYFLEVATYGTHQRNGRGVHRSDPKFPPAFRDRPHRRHKSSKKHRRSDKHRNGNCGRVGCKSLDVRDLSGWNDKTWDNRPRYANGRKARAWQPHKRLGRRVAKRLSIHYRNRARMAQSVDRLVARVLATTGRDTYIFVTSDNGFHLGQHRMQRGKGTAYGHDIQVPLIVHGPGVEPGSRSQVVSNVDLASTFEDIAGVSSGVNRDGRSMLPVLRSPRAKGQRYAFVEHRRPDPNDPADPDSERGIGAIPSYIAVRSKHMLLVRYDLDRDPDTVRYAYEFYRRLGGQHRYERRNAYRPGNPHVRTLKRRIEEFDGCSGASCRAATK